MDGTNATPEHNERGARVENWGGKVVHIRDEFVAARDSREAGVASTEIRIATNQLRQDLSWIRDTLEEILGERNRLRVLQASAKWRNMSRVHLHIGYSANSLETLERELRAEETRLAAVLERAS